MQRIKTLILRQSPQTLDKRKFRSRLFTGVKFLLLILAVAVAGGYLYLQQPQFDDPIVAEQSYQGKYYAGTFHNPVDVPVNTGTDSLYTSLYKFLFQEQADAKPEMVLPSVKTDLLTLDPTENMIVWMGHSSYFIQIDGIRILVDPVFSNNASPVPMTNTSFHGSNIYSAEDIPKADYLLISHDHWDHLDYLSIRALHNKVTQVITPIGVGSYLTQWGYSPDQIHEGDWFSTFDGGDLQIHILPAQHFSGRLLKRNRTLWGSFALVTPQHKLYISGDSGYSEHFKAIADKLGGFDIAILEVGQYNQDWKYIHMMPEEAAQAGVDLQAKAIIPAHNSRFKLSRHSWYEPLERIDQASKGMPYRLLTPRIGESVQMDDTTQTFRKWWRNVQ
ncbi:MBL fold metallo-hydrolase [Vibrio mangrovi]|uniref:MBL fold metallo-hydrolase n=1 Tax=Vibrio mangrovi TaxID=474394 RepID=A0A1Y6IQP9_9VIBR|nr:MBL fold metallo-hydrolase [Vibrio mangrovi]MDW6003264.1 MBL fold metallo-hydrolase [Vibrio mangrovi]SMR99948.1 metal-dependent hydrolase [Vibrio mangrovi]